MPDALKSILSSKLYLRSLERKRTPPARLRLRKPLGTCKNCGKTCKSSKHKYCYQPCKPPKYAVTSFKAKGIASGTVGAIAELAVAADLMTGGFHVFRALSPNAPCDLIAFNDKVTMNLEVRSGVRTSSGRIAFGTDHHEKATHFAAYVHQERTVFYFDCEENPVMIDAK